MSETERKKKFSLLEKKLFLTIIPKHDAILSCKQTNTTTANTKKSAWEAIGKEFNSSSIVTHQASTKQLVKLWYNMKAKARELKTKENARYLSGGRPSVVDMDAIDAKVMDVDKNLLTNIEIDIDSDTGSVIIPGYNNNEGWSKPSVINGEERPEINVEQLKRYHQNKYDTMNNIDSLKCKLLEEELTHKRKIHEVELEIIILEREYKEKILKIELEIKHKALEKMNK